MRGPTWQEAEKAIVRSVYPQEGSPGVERELLRHGFVRDQHAIQKWAYRNNVQVDPATRKRLSSENASLMWAARCGEYTKGDKAKEAAARRAQIRSQEYLKSPYRDLTPSTVWWLRLCHSRGDTAEKLAKEHNRPLWFVQAVIEGREWQERWDEEREREGER